MYMLFSSREQHNLIMIASIFLYREQMDDIESKRAESPIGTRY